MKSIEMNTEKEQAAEDFENTWKLDTIPPELFLHICSYLSAKFVIRILSEVCKKFRDIIQDDTTWRTRIAERWPKRYPLIKADNFSWKEACIEREEHYRLWSNDAACMKIYNIHGAHYAAVDVVLLLQDGQLCASGSRDHSVKLWDLNLLSQLPIGTDYTTCLKDMKLNAHRGWIWSMANQDHALYTGAWDGSIKSWDLLTSGNHTNTYNLNSAVLCLAFSQNILAAGTYDRVVSLVDPRESRGVIMQHSHHRKAVLCLVADDKFVISGSEDRTLVVYDKIAGKVQNTLAFDGFPMSLSYGHNQLLMGDKLGFIHLVDPRDGKFELLKTYPSGHKNKVTGVQHSLGTIITCSTDKTICILEPNADPLPIATLTTSGEVAGVSSFGTTLVSANSDSSMSVWMPNHEALQEI